MTLPNEFLEKRLLLRPAEAADALGIGRSKIYHLFAIVRSHRFGSVAASGFPLMSYATGQRTPGKRQ